MCFIWCICLFEETLNQCRQICTSQATARTREKNIGCGAVWEKRKKTTQVTTRHDLSSNK